MSLAENRLGQEQVPRDMKELAGGSRARKPSSGSALAAQTRVLAPGSSAGPFPSQKGTFITLRMGA
jgi:hypothetical protein